jgi:hypothetical protein
MKSGKEESDRGASENSRKAGSNVVCVEAIYFSPFAASRRGAIAEQKCLIFRCCYRDKDIFCRACSLPLKLRREASSRRIDKIYPDSCISIDGE